MRTIGPRRGSRYLGALLFLLALFVSGPVAAHPAAPGPGLLVGPSPDRSAARPLRGTVFGQVYVFAPGSGVKNARFYLDDPGARGRPFARSGRSGRTPLDTTRLTDGVHRITAVVKHRAGPSTLHATFRTPHLFGAPAGAASGPCSRRAPCSNLDRAYRLAGPGQVVELAAGTYPGQVFRLDSSRSAAADVVVRPADGAKVEIAGEVLVNARHLELRDLTLRSGWKTLETAEDVTFRRVSTLHMFIWSSSNVSVIGGEVGPNPRTDYDSQITTLVGSQKTPTNILIDRVNFHDWIDVDPNQSNHIECLQVGSGINVTIRRSRFQRCSTHGVFVRSWGDINGGAHPLQNWLFENNFFGRTSSGFFAVNFSSDLSPATCSKIVFRNNSSMQQMVASDCSDIRWVGNLSERAAFVPCTGTFSHNVWFASWSNPAKCSASDRSLRTGDPGFVDGASGDLRLRPSSPAVSRGDPRNFPTVDMDGERRPKGRLPEAGADELR